MLQQIPVSTSAPSNTARCRAAPEPGAEGPAHGAAREGLASPPEGSAALCSYTNLKTTLSDDPHDTPTLTRLPRQERVQRSRGRCGGLLGMVSAQEG